MCKHKTILLLFLFFMPLYAIEVLLTTEKIHYNQIVGIKQFKKAEIRKLNKICKPLKFEDLKEKKYVATHYMKENYIICRNDLKEYKKNFILFNFGAIQIQREGKVIFENKEYIKIKKINGKIKKIYKDGRVR